MKAFLLVHATVYLLALLGVVYFLRRDRYPRPVAVAITKFVDVFKLVWLVLLLGWTIYLYRTA